MGADITQGLRQNAGNGARCTSGMKVTEARGLISTPFRGIFCINDTYCSMGHSVLLLHKYLLTLTQRITILLVEPPGFLASDP